MRKILVTATNYSQLCANGKKILESNGFEVIENPLGRPMTLEERKPYLPEIEAAIVGPGTWDDEVYALAPNLKCIGRFGIGVDNLDLNAAKARGITVFNAAGSNSKAVAEHAIALMFGLVRQLPQLNKSTREGKWERLTFREFSSLTIGFIGFGGIARLTAERLAPFGSRLIAYDKFPNKEAAQERNVTLTSLEEVLRTSDIVSIHAPSLPDTFHMINREALAMMKKTAYLVNTARGPLVDELALYDALVSGTLAGAGLDVYEQEPISPDNPLLSLDCVLCTPHSAAETLETYHNVGTFTAENVVAYFQGRTPENWLNP